MWPCGKSGAFDVLWCLGALDWRAAVAHAAAAGAAVALAPPAWRTYTELFWSVGLCGIVGFWRWAAQALRSSPHASLALTTLVSPSKCDCFYIQHAIECNAQ